MNAKNSTGGISKNTGKIKKDLQTTIGMEEQSPT